MVSILNIGTSGQLLLGARLFTLFTRLRRPAGGLSDFGRLVLARSRRPSRWVVLLRCRIGRDEFFTSDNDQGVYLSISVWWTFSPRFTFAPRRDFSFLIDRVRGASRCVCLCFLSAAEMVGVGVG